MFIVVLVVQNYRRFEDIDVLLRTSVPQVQP